MPDSNTEALTLSLRELIGRSTEPHLPAMRSMAKSFGCDIHSISRALHTLRDEGLLVFRRGQRIRIAGKPFSTREAAPEPWISTSSRLAGQIEQRIISGEFRAGDRLPKVEYFVRTWSVSSTTVKNAFRSLAQRGLVHRRDRGWVAGRESQQLRTASFDILPVILLIQPKRFTWEGLLTHMSMRFISMFKSEVERRNVRLLACSTERFAPGPALPFEDTESALNMMAHERMYTGSLIIGRPEEYPNFEEILGKVASLGKPSVWFDRRNDGAFMKRYGSMYRCVFSEEQFTNASIGFLKSMNHSCAGYLGVADYSWQESRGRQLAEFANSQDFELLLYQDLIARLKKMGTGDLASHLGNLLRQGTPVASRTLMYLLRSLPDQSGGTENGLLILAQILKIYPDLPFGSTASGFDKAAFLDLLSSETAAEAFWHIENLLPFLLTPRVTAIISPRDRSTPNPYGKLTEIGIRVPDDLSLISYDNQLKLAFIPVTTIDNGAEELGYQAFHAIMGDVPLRADRSGLIVAKPVVVRRGSVKRLP